MDCNTARLLLEFARPNHSELDPYEARALEAHVASCPGCAQDFLRERQMDEQIGKALRNVDVPDRLRSHLLSRLAADRSVCRARRLKKRAGGVLAVAAALLFSVGGWLVYRQAMLKPIDVGALDQKVIDISQSPPDRVAVEEAFRRQGVDMVAPTTFDFAFLAHYGMGELQEREVPCLIFIRHDKWAKVYVASDRQFNLKELTSNYQSPSGYKYKVDIQHDLGSRFAYVIFHTGDSLDWLQRLD